MLRGLRWRCVSLLLFYHGHARQFAGRHVFDLTFRREIYWPPDVFFESCRIKIFDRDLPCTNSGEIHPFVRLSLLCHTQPDITVKRRLIIRIDRFSAMKPVVHVDRLIGSETADLSGGTIRKFTNTPGYRRRQGHRQKLTQVKVTGIDTGSKK